MQRVRSEMGHVVTNAGAISVMVDNNRDVTLTGRVLAGELDGLLSTVNKVPGVNQIINRLDVQDSPEAVAGGDAGTTAGQRL
jgi:osmotically-inducible protein OsmY